ncbi:MAG: hypothetical protein K2N17_02150 [Clostridia bacterium]|nr:hypothetical protein [Clostridia bacterium]
MRINGKMRLFIICAVAAVVIAVIILICAVPFGVSKLGYEKTFYYVCYDSPSDAHSASSMSSVVHSYGGAGYIIENKGRYYVTVSCYYNDTDAQSVCATLNKKGLKCSVLEVEAGDYNLGGSARGKKEKYLGNLNTMTSLSRMCYDLANSLDGYSCDQSGAKAVLQDVKTGLEGLARNNAANCFSSEIANLCAECDDVSHGYVFSYDVRRLQIAIIDSLVNIRLY